MVRKSERHSRFGLELAMIREIQRSDGVLRPGLYVPTEYELKHAPAYLLNDILHEWFYMSPESLRPSIDVLWLVLELIRNRRDHRELKELIAICVESIVSRS